MTLKITCIKFCSTPSHYLNQCCIIVNLALWNTFQSNCIRNLNMFIQENAFENVVWKMSAILSRPQCVNVLFVGHIHAYNSCPLSPQCIQWLVLYCIISIKVWLSTKTNLTHRILLETNAFLTFCAQDNPGEVGQCNAFDGLNPGVTAASAALYVLGPRLNGHHSVDDIINCILLKENFWISNRISFEYDPWGVIDKSALVQIMDWRRIGGGPLSEPIII